MRVLLIVLGWALVGLGHAAPPPGHPSVDQAQRMIHVPNEADLVHQGRVLQAISSNDYTYIEVTTDDKGGTRWLAAPNMELPADSQIRYGDGAVMKNFYSRKHSRTFAEVWFVDEVKRLAE